jgi:glycine cleavage system regulatory protein
MAVEMVLSVLAGDRPGLVEMLSRAVAGVEGNWIDSSMTRLGGEFAGIVRVTIPDEGVARFEAAIEALSSDGLTTLIRRGGQDIEAPVGQVATIELTGSDQPGIVHEVSRILAQFGVSIDDLQTEIFTGSMSGEQLFSARARIIIPEDVQTDTLLTALEDTASDLMVEIELTEAASEA